MGFRPAGSDGKLGRSRSYSHLQEPLVNPEPPPLNAVRTKQKRASWGAPLAPKQKVDSLPVTQTGFEKVLEGGLLSPTKKGGTGAGWKKEARRVGRALVVIVLLALIMATLLRSLFHMNEVRFNQEAPAPLRSLLGTHFGWFKMVHADCGKAREC